MLIRADIIKFSVEELDYLAEAMKQPARQIIQRYSQEGDKLIVVTDGGNPLAAYARGNRLTVAPPKTKVVDTTGAGDAFVGGLLADCDEALSAGKTFSQWLQPTLLEPALLRASASGAKACQKKGAFEAMPKAT